MDRANRIYIRPVLQQQLDKLQIVVGRSYMQQGAAGRDGVRARPGDQDMVGTALEIALRVAVDQPQPHELRVPLDGMACERSLWI